MFFKMAEAVEYVASPPPSPVVSTGVVSLALLNSDTKSLNGKIMTYLPSCENPGMVNFLLIVCV